MQYSKKELVSALREQLSKSDSEIMAVISLLKRWHLSCRFYVK